MWRVFGVGWGDKWFNILLGQKLANTGSCVDRALSCNKKKSLEQNAAG
jgi:hypothetical protein